MRRFFKLIFAWASKEKYLIRINLIMSRGEASQSINTLGRERVFFLLSRFRTAKRDVKIVAIQAMIKKEIYNFVSLVSFTEQNNFGKWNNISYSELTFPIKMAFLNRISRRVNTENLLDFSISEVLGSLKQTTTFF